MDKHEKSYHRLLVWQKLSELVVLTYTLTKLLPKDELFSLTSQMRRAAVSALSNFVEGYLKKSNKEKLHFMEIAETSLLELEAQSEVCLLLKYWTEEMYQNFDKARAKASYFLYQYRAKINS